MSTYRTVAFASTTQYYVTFAQSGLSSDALGTVVTVGSAAKVYGDLPFSEWVDNGGSVTYSFASPVASAGSPSAIRYRWDSTSGLSQTLQSNTFTVSAAGTVTGSYVTQFYVTFTQSGVGVDFSGTVMTVGGTDYNRDGHSDWYDSGASVAYSYASPLNVDAEKRYFKTSTDASPLAVSATTTITGVYKTQFYVTFDQSGSGVAPKVTYHINSSSDFQTTAEFSVWVDSGSSITYSYESLVAGASGTQYVLTGTSPASPQTVSAEFDVTGTYKTQYQLTVTSSYGTPGGGGYYDSGATAYATLTDGTVPGGAGTQYVFTSWGTDASGTNYAQSNAITMNAAKTATANWKTQYYLTVNDGGHSSAGGAGWYDAGVTAHYSVTSPSV
jgi:hypothetical protein